MALLILLPGAAIGAGAYTYFGFQPEPIDAKAATDMLKHLRQSPSTQEGLTVDQRLEKELLKSKASGKLVRFRGWETKPFGHLKQKMLISYSFEEEGSGEQVAEWLVDNTTRTFIPQTPLATEVFRGR